MRLFDLREVSKEPSETGLLFLGSNLRHSATRLRSGTRERVGIPEIWPFTEHAVIQHRHPRCLKVGHPECAEILPI